MAASNASKISKALSKIVSPSVESPKKSIRTTPSHKAQTTSGTVFKKPAGVPKRLVPKTVKEVNAEEPVRLVSNTVKKVKATLAVPTPTRRPPSIPLSPWNADHSEVVKSASKTEAAVAGAKKKVTTPKPKASKSAALKKNIPSKTSEKSQSNASKLICNDAQKPLTTRIVPATVFASSNTTGQMKTDASSVKSVKPETVTKPVSPSTESSLAQNYTCPSFSATMTALQEKLNVINETVYSIRQLKAYNVPAFGGNDDQIEKKRSSDKALRMSENGSKETASPKYFVNNTYIYLNESNPTNSDTPDKNETMSDISGLGVSPGMQNNSFSLTASTVNKLNNTVVPKRDNSSPRVRRSLDGISSPRRSLAGDSDKPCSPFVQPSPRVFERQFVDLADDLFSPYITDGENASAMRSPRNSL